ncbi:MAG: phosphate transport system ATP-binding protein [Candidatus Peregrinibacteria bacterium Greene0416_19]|nr:MAG: phosphate transport system ATP-binding protein [Candidatus Peregrinibacteria bacterium Greene0416_19]
MTAPIISVRSLDVHYGSVTALHDVSFDIAPNEITGLIGASGSGKSTFLRSLNRMLDHLPTVRMGGTITIGGENILHEKTDVVRLRRRVGMVFQNPTPFPKSVFDNVAYGLEIQGIRNPRKSFLSLTRLRIQHQELEASDDPIDQAVVRSLKEAALWEEVKHRLHHSAYRLSGGQQQRLCIARAIAIRPDILLLDEPCSSLDPLSTRCIEQLLLGLKKDYTILIVTHNLQQARRIADHVGFFHTGELVEFGTAKEIFGGPGKTLTREYVEGAFG